VKSSVTSWIRGLDIQSIYSGIGIGVDVEFDYIDRQIYIFPFKVEEYKNNVHALFKFIISLFTLRSSMSRSLLRGLSLVIQKLFGKNDKLLKQRIKVGHHPADKEH
jgi:hypothetical protein